LKQRLVIKYYSLFQPESNPLVHCSKLYSLSHTVFPGKCNISPSEKTSTSSVIGFIKISMVLCVSAEPREVTFQRDLLDPRDGREGKNSCRPSIALSHQLDMARVKICREKKDY